MNLDCKHITIRVSDTTKSKEFYIDKLGLTLLDEKPNFIAAQVGQLRLSFFGGHSITDQSAEKYVGTSIIFSTDDIEKTRNKLVEFGLELSIDITNANNYLKFIALNDPDGLLVEIAQYLVKDTLENKL